MEGTPRRRLFDIASSSDRYIAFCGLLILGVALTIWGHRSHECWFPSTSKAKEVCPRVEQASMSYALQRPKFLLLGDSLTERGFSMGGWVAGLAHHYQRRVDVVNRGFGGYNTNWALQITPDLLQGCDNHTTQLVTIFFGANDAARPDGPSVLQHVPVLEYKENLKELVSKVRATGVKRIVLLTPPPVHDKGRKEWQVVKVGEEVASTLTLDRTLDYTADYARACVDVGKEQELPVINLYDIMQQEQGWGTTYFCDGLHFTPEGNQVVLKHLLQTLETAYPAIKMEEMALHMPPWDMVDDKVLASLQDLRKKGAYATKPLPANHPVNTNPPPKNYP